MGRGEGGRLSAGSVIWQSSMEGEEAVICTFYEGE